jgi:hypothetical protein
MRRETLSCVRAALIANKKPAEGGLENLMVAGQDLNLRHSGYERVKLEVPQVLPRLPRAAAPAADGTGRRGALPRGARPHLQKPALPRA